MKKFQEIYENFFMFCNSYGSREEELTDCTEVSPRWREAYIK